MALAKGGGTALPICRYLSPIPVKKDTILKQTILTLTDLERGFIHLAEDFLPERYFIKPMLFPNVDAILDAMMMLCVLRKNEL